MTEPKGLTLCIKFSADNIVKYFFFSFLFFPKIQVLTFPVNLYEMSNVKNVKSCFPAKIRKKITNLSSAELAQRVVMVNSIFVHDSQAGSSNMAISHEPKHGLNLQPSVYKLLQ